VASVPNDASGVVLDGAERADGSPEVCIAGALGATFAGSAGWRNGCSSDERA
jgi:hypothetical protein